MISQKNAEYAKATLTYLEESIIVEIAESKI